ncbi:universal stress protein [Xanthobacter autotrophicus DSM 431]|uniref:universal stress protein n=1 Tax=Xanthobacter nonsaccharivorans TaxID=3119912 RepID=UPI00372A5AC1
MTGTSAAQGAPKSILLATDLSPRCDRALDRALLLSQQWQASLVVLHVLEGAQGAESDWRVPSWRRPPDPASVAHRQLLADVGVAVDKAEIVIGEGDPADEVARVAAEKGCDLIVTGIARDELFGRVLLGTTVDRLLRRSPLPLLVVRNRARHDYREIAVAADFSAASRYAFEMAIRIFPADPLTVFHAYESPLGGLAPDSDALRRQWREVALQDCAAFLAAVDAGGAARGRVRSFVEYGAPANVLRQGVRDMGIELLVLGTHGRSALIEMLIGSVAKAILDEVTCDVLIVRDPQVAAGADDGPAVAAGAAPQEGGASTR